MGRPVYPHELNDPDINWLISNYKELHPSCLVMESGMLPVVLIGAKVEETDKAVRELVMKSLNQTDASGIEAPEAPCEIDSSHSDRKV